MKFAILVIITFDKLFLHFVCYKQSKRFMRVSRFSYLFSELFFSSDHVRCCSSCFVCRILVFMPYPMPYPPVMTFCTDMQMCYYLFVVTNENCFNDVTYLMCRIFLLLLLFIWRLVLFLPLFLSHFHLQQMYLYLCGLKLCKLHIIKGVSSLSY